MFAYVSHRIPEISDELYKIDDIKEWKINLKIKEINKYQLILKVKQLVFQLLLLYLMPF